MATLNYNTRLQNLKTRRFDEILQKSALSENFGRSVLPENLEYLIESMRPIGSKYNSITAEAASNVQKHLERDLQLHFTRDYRTQGSVITGNNIKVHSDIDLLAVVGRYYYLAPSLPNPFPYTDSDPDEDIKKLRQEATKILQKQYDIVDNSGRKSISIYNKNLKRKVDIVFCYWYQTPEYQNSGNEVYKGIYLYDFPQSRKELDFPFLHMHEVNLKGELTNDGSRRATRLLKTLKADSEKIILSSFQLTTIVHQVENSLLYYSPGRELSIAKAASDELTYIIDNPNYRRTILSPNKKETPLSDDSIVPSLEELNKDLKQLTSDCSLEVANTLTQKKILTY